jgi:LemA protein
VSAASWVLLATVALALAWSVGAYNRLVRARNRIGFARQAYNDQVLQFNDAAPRFPDLLVARLGGFAPAAMLQATQSTDERSAPKVQF